VDANDLRHAYAVLGVNPPITPEHLKHRYKELVTRWHPDRFQSDPKARVEAEIMMRNINIAYGAASAASTSTQSPPDSAASEPVTPLPHRPAERPFSLTPEQVDAIVDQINRSNQIFPWPVEMSIERWLSLAVATACIAALSVAYSVGMLRTSGMMLALLYLPWPVCLIWKQQAKKDDERDLTRLYRFLGWLLLTVPAIVTLAYLRTPG
jgi:hypothetical protein